MDASVRIRFVGLGIQLTLLGALVAVRYGEVGLSVVVGTFVTGWGVI